MSLSTKAQFDSLSAFHLSYDGYIETYFLYDFQRPGQNLRPSFYVSHHRHNEFNLNIGFVRFKAENKKVKAAFGLMTGTYTNANMINEKGVLKNILEANVAVKLASKRNLWMQMGVFNSHIGFESAIGADCYNLTRSIAADNSPYFETGARLNFTHKNEKLFLSFLVLNGWQNIERTLNNDLPALGTQITFTDQLFTFNSSNYFGNHGTNAMPIWRYFHNLYLIKKLGKKSNFIVGLDVGMQQSNSHKNNWFYWYSPQLVYQYHLSSKLNLTYRLEHFSDKNNIIVTIPKNSVFQVFGHSLNLDYKILESALIRIEFKQLNNKDFIFLGNQSNYNYNLSAAIAFTVRF
jgi:hypothetical protein